MDITQELEKYLPKVRPYEVPYLYKYRSMEEGKSERVLEVFSKSQVFLPDPTMFNDPFDCRPYVRPAADTQKNRRFLMENFLTREPNAKRSVLKKNVKAYLAKLGNYEARCDLYRSFIKKFGIYSLTEVPDDILMWAHYADFHKGLCLQFRADIPDSFFWKTLKVIYQHEYPQVSLLDAGLRVEFYNALLTKSIRWKYEEERRIINSPPEGGRGTYPFAPELLTGVILGAMVSSENEERICEWVKGYPTPVGVYKANLNEKEYKLDIPGLPSRKSEK